MEAAAAQVNCDATAAKAATARATFEIAHADQIVRQTAGYKGLETSAYSLP
ncbi:MAG: hypothetical protein QOI12_3676 [Alphaproteobacteria bacterium]|jgi:hypothetical protein|nr:hypothetical protein [Alphaproteobacteria bacterium]